MDPALCRRENRILRKVISGYKMVTQPVSGRHLIFQSFCPDFLTINATIFGITLSFLSSQTQKAKPGFSKLTSFMSMKKNIATFSIIYF